MPCKAYEKRRSSETTAAPDVAASRGSSPGLDVIRGRAALLLLATLAPARVVAQRTPQPVFTELFADDLAAPSQLLVEVADLQSVRQQAAAVEDLARK